MKVIGITGGIGAGKSQILSHLEKNYNCKVVKADEIAQFLKQPGENCYRALVELLGNEILNENHTINNELMAKKIFLDDSLLEKVNSIIHPAVKNFIVHEISIERSKELLMFFFVEAALLIEDHYDEIVDELWYIYAAEKTRMKRLQNSRDYSLDKINSIFQKQLSEKEFQEKCQILIDNNGEFSHTIMQIEQTLEDYL